MDEIKRICEKAIECYEADKSKKEQNVQSYIFIREEQDFYSADQDSIESISISELAFKGRIPEQLYLPNLRQFSGTIERLEAMKDHFDPDNIEEMSIKLYNIEERSVLYFPNVKKLQLTFPNREEVPEKRVGIDFSGFDSVKELSITYGSCVDYSCIEELPSLRKLRITDPQMVDVRWLKERYYPIDNICLHGKIESLEGIESQWATTFLQLDRNSITDISPLKELKYLEYLNLYGNPIRNIGELRVVPRLILNDKDMDLEHIDSMIEEWMNVVARNWSHMIRSIEDARTLNFIQKNFAEKSMEEQVIQLLQLKFETEFAIIKPGFPMRYYDESYKSYFLNAARDKYPMLQLTDNMQEILKNERTNYAEKYPAMEGRIPFLNSGRDFYIIDACIIRREGGNRVKGISDEINRIIEKVWFDYAYDLNYYVGAEVSITSLYNTTPNEEIAFAVIMAMRSAYYHFNIPEKAVLTAALSSSGKLKKQMGISSGNINLLKMIGYKQACVVGSQLDCICKSDIKVV